MSSIGILTIALADAVCFFSAACGLMAPAEYNRSYSNRRYLPTDRRDVLRDAPSTIALRFMRQWSIDQGSSYPECSHA